MKAVVLLAGMMLGSMAHADLYASAIGKVCSLKDSLNLMPRQNCIQNARFNARYYQKILNAVQANLGNKAYVSYLLRDLNQRVSHQLGLLAYLPISNELSAAAKNIQVAIDATQDERWDVVQIKSQKAIQQLEKFQQEIR